VTGLLITRRVMQCHNSLYCSQPRDHSCLTAQSRRPVGEVVLKYGDVRSMRESR
jgi:hypothetical protein